MNEILKAERLTKTYGKSIAMTVSYSGSWDAKRFISARKT